MEYLLTIYTDESASADATHEQAVEMLDAYNRFGEANAEVIRGGHGLEPTATATSVRVRDGERLLTDGPFAETKEQLGGFYLIEVDSLDDALAIAAQVPAAQFGTVEVRPVMNYDALREKGGAAVEGAQA